MAASASDAHPFPIYNARFRVVVPILDADGDLVTGAAGLDTELSQDTGTFADATNEATEIGATGMYYLDLIATELDTKSTAGIVKTSSTGAKTTPFVLYPTRLPVLLTGTAQAGGASTITLPSGASAIDDYYVGCFVNITNNSPTNALGQARRIVGYVGSTKVATVEGTYGTNPSSASTLEILATDAWAWKRADLLASGGVATTQTGGRPEVNTSHAAGTAWGSGAITAGSIASNALPAAKFAADFFTAIITAVWTTAAARILTAATNITSTGGTTVPQTGDSYARLGAPSGASVSADVAAIKAKTDQLVFTVTNKIDATIQLAGDFAQGAADKVWSTAARTLTAFGFSVTVGTNSDKTGYALTSGERTAIANAVETEIIDDTDSEKVLTAITDKIASVNPSLDDLTLGGIASAVRTELTTELGRIDAAISSRLATGGYTTPPTAAANASAVRTELGTELGRIDQAISTRLASGSYSAPPSAATNASAVRTELGTELARIDAATSTRATPAQVVSSVSGIAVEGDISLVQAMRVILAAAAGELSGAQTEEVEITRGGGGAVRITAQVDEFGNRLSVTLNTAA